ncbi:MAG: alpha/beta fold hydrolase [Pseudomonadota bacterium]
MPSKAIEMVEEVVSIPVDGADVSLVATVFRPDGPGPFPSVIVSHGEPSNASARGRYGYWRQPHLTEALVARGFAVVVPVRRGFGVTGGKYVGGYGGCSSSQPRFYEGSMRAAEDILASMRYASKLPYIDGSKMILVGQSAGGIASLAAANTKPNGLIMVANFSGGRGGQPKKTPGYPCHAEALANAIGEYAKNIDVPVLWHYVEDDDYFSPKVARMWFAAFEGNGGKGKLVVQPPFGSRAHNILLERDGIPVWGKVFDDFLLDVGIFNKNRPES